MENTIENFQFCMDLVLKRFVNLRIEQHRAARFDEVMKALADTLLKACTSREIAKAVADAAYGSEEFVPAPATLRKYLRGMNCVEEDVRKAEVERTRRDIAAQRQQLGVA